MWPVLFLALAAALSPPGAEDPAVHLPPGAAADLVRRLAAEAASAGAPSAAWPADEGGAWSACAVWERWSELVRAEAAADAPDPARRAALALAAVAQARFEDAWTHFAATAADPGAAAALLPRLFPGVPADAPAGRAGRPGALPEGVLLSPALPPLDLASEIGRPRVRAAGVRGLAIGAALCDFELSVEADGVELAFTHVSGPSARFALLVPLPIDMEPSQVYVDWAPLPEGTDAGVPIELELAPGADGAPGETTVWVRLRPRVLDWPAPAEPALTEELRGGGFALAIDRGTELGPALACAAAELSRLLGIEGRVWERGAEPPGAAPGSLPPRIFAFPASAPLGLRRAKLLFLVSATERLCLAGT